MFDLNLNNNIFLINENDIFHKVFLLKMNKLEEEKTMSYNININAPSIPSKFKCKYTSHYKIHMNNRRIAIIFFISICLLLLG
jgi:hypothetical protein